MRITRLAAAALVGLGSTVATLGAFTPTAQANSGSFLGDKSCAGVIQSYGEVDFFETLYSPDVDAPRKPGTFVYAGDAVDVVSVLDSGFTGISFPLQRGTVGYLPSQLVVKQCGAAIPEPERALYPGIDF